MSNNSNTEAAILARVMKVEPPTPAAAKYLLSFRFGEQDITRMNELSELAQQGKLTAESKLSSTAIFMSAIFWL